MGEEIDAVCLLFQSMNFPIFLLKKCRGSLNIILGICENAYFCIRLKKDVRNMKKTILIFISTLLLSGQMMAQEEVMPKQKRITYERMTEQMVKSSE